MNPFEFVIALVAIAYVGRIIQIRQMGKYGIKPRRLGRGLRFMGPLTVLGDDQEDAVDNAETDRLRDEVKALKERIQVLERIAVEKENSLARQIEELRDR